MQRHTVDSHGGQVVWRTFGTGQPLVLLHGGHGNWLHWVRNIEALALNRRVCVPDMPGYGESSAMDVSELGPLVQRLSGSLNQLVGSSTGIDLVGFSFGGLVAANLAARRGSIQKLALLGPAGHGGTRRPRLALQSWSLAAQTGDESGLQSIMRHNLLAHMLHEESSVDELALHVHTEACLKTRFRSKPISRSGQLWELLSDPRSEILVICGEHDVTLDPQQLVSQLALSVPEAKSIVVQDAGHWVQYESAPVVNTLLNKWLNQSENP